MSVPQQIDDGDWALATDMSVEYDFPFSDKGDNDTFAARVKIRQDKQYYKPVASMSKRKFDLGDAYLTKLGSPRDIGCGLYEYDNEYSAVPRNRVEPGSYGYTIQWWEGVAESNVDPSKYFYNVNFDLEEQTFTVSARVYYEYFKDTPPKPLIKPRVFLLFGILKTIGGTPNYNGEVIAEDSQISIWRAGIFCRRTVKVTISALGDVT